MLTFEFNIAPLHLNLQTTVVPGQSVSITNTDTGEARTFKIGDIARYGTSGYPLVGKILNITPKAIIVQRANNINNHELNPGLNVWEQAWNQPNGRARVAFEYFSWLNINFNFDQIKSDALLAENIRVQAWGGNPPPRDTAR
jgi:hypothetical protein